MTSRRALPLALASFLLLLAASPAAAKEGYWEGKPEVSPGEHKGYFLWHDNAGWHLRWTTKEARHRFSGTISCDGAFEGVRRVSADDKKDAIARKGRNAITFDTRVAAGVDGIDFRVTGGTGTLTFDLLMDGQRVPTNRVKVGRNKRFPPSVPVTIERP